jgi:hypothetical protein
LGNSGRQAAPVCLLRLGPSRTRQILNARAAQQGAEAELATANSVRRLVVFGNATWALRSAVGGGPGS